MSKAQELVDYLNARIERTGYNERQWMANRAIMPDRLLAALAKVGL